MMTMHPPPQSARETRHSLDMYRYFHSQSQINDFLNISLHCLRPHRHTAMKWRMSLHLTSLRPVEIIGDLLPLTFSPRISVRYREFVQHGMLSLSPIYGAILPLILGQRTTESMVGTLTTQLEATLTLKSCPN